MRIDLTKVVMAAGVGVADELIERNDAKHGKTGLDGWTIKGRAVAVIGGHLLGMFMPKYGDVGETIATAATPLLTKSVVSYFMDKKPAGTGHQFIGRNVSVGPSAKNWVPTSAGGGSYRRMS